MLQGHILLVQQLSKNYSARWPIFDGCASSKVRPHYIRYICLSNPDNPGIFPREPRHRKRANKGSSAPTSFYYAKDIAYLAHEPVLRKLREHKAFAKKLARALGRGEWSSAKSLEENKPVYTLDHIIKERYGLPIRSIISSEVLSGIQPSLMPCETSTTPCA